MGVGLFLFRTLTLQSEKSSLNLRLASLSRQKRQMSREIGIFSRQFNQTRNALTKEFQDAQKAARDANADQSTLTGASSSSLNCLEQQAFQQLYTNYQLQVQQLEMQQEEKEREIKEKEEDIEAEMKEVQTQLEQIDAELKEAEKAASQAAKDGAPKYVA